MKESIDEEKQVKIVDEMNRCKRISKVDVNDPQYKSKL